MPDGKPANTPCVQLDESLRCKFLLRRYDQKCGGLQPSAEMCGQTTHQAMVYLIELEALTAP
jgi:hypothetical protein